VVLGAEVLVLMADVDGAGGLVADPLVGAGLGVVLLGVGEVHGFGASQVLKRWARSFGLDFRHIWNMNYNERENNFCRGWLVCNDLKKIFAGVG